MPSQVSISPSGQIYPEYTIEGSQDLLHWRPVGGKVRGVGGLSGSMLDVSLPNDTDLGFYRTLVSTNSETTNETASGGADVYGYNSRFAAQISQLQSMSLADFSSNFQVPPYLSQLDWDPTTAQYWTNFSGNPNFALNSSEFSIFRTNGFVVSERLGNQSFAQVYYQILTADMPVFISADSILHAWHLAYDNILEEMEEQELSPLMEKVITNMALQIPRTAELLAKALCPTAFKTRISS
jgi:hypothetical protein